MSDGMVKYVPYGMFGAAVIASVLNILIGKAAIVESFLLWFLVVGVGLESLWAFIGHAFAADDVAKSIGWPAGNPFQFEVALHNLAVGILGILCFWLRGDFWIAAVVAFSVFGLGAAYGHITDMRRHHNYAPGNVGPILYLGDIFTPLLLIGLLIVYRVL